MNAIEPQNATPAPAVVDDVIARGDLSKLTPQQRVVHYHNVCRSLGLNHLTEPFQYITLNGKLKLYAKRDAADQLRKINGINVEIVSRTVQDGLLTVHARATDKAGRRDEDFGVVSIAGLRGEAAANAILKAVTKAKRRVTLSIAGLGFLDETEVEDIPDAETEAPKPNEPPRVAIANPDTYKEDLRRDLNRDPIEKAEPPADPLSSDDYLERWEMRLADADSADDLTMLWNSERALRNEITWPDRMTPAKLRDAVTRRIEELKHLANDKPDLATQRLNAEDA
jgi:hypothetical protein